MIYKDFARLVTFFQRTVHKDKIKKVPLEQMSRIDDSSQRVAVDLVGTLSPITDKGNRCILTLLDCFFTPKLPNSETERIAEALMDIFLRIVKPREKLTDMGA